MAERPRIVLIAGPTASGKSALALEMAERLGGAVVNADSMQVYRDLRILTSRPSAADEARAPHLLYGHVDAAEPYSAGRFLAEAGPLIARADRPLVFAGGTGLYFEALTRGLSAIPPIPPGVRAHWREFARARPSEALHEELRRRDPEAAARLRPGDRQRLTRALEVLEGTGVSILRWQEMAASPVIDPSEAVRIVLAVERPVLRERIARRFAGMLEKGALEEVRALRDRGLDPGLPAMKAIGVPQLAGVLDSQADLASAAARAVTVTGQYAKRQETWFRNRLGDWLHVPADAARRLV